VPLSFEEFVTSSSPRLVRAARLLLGNAAEAEDMTQETLIVMYRRWGQLRDPVAADAYAYKTLVRLTRRHQRRARFRHEFVTSDELVGMPASGASDEFDDGLTQALLTLAPRQREAVVLRYFLDLSIDDTATLMGCSPGTVKSQVSRALTSLRTNLDADRPSRTKAGEL
jgi:RNA polymerase sigma-70 factor (sigma-E family)